MKKIQSYEIIEELGIGGMGTVYKVRHDFKKNIYAIKSLHPQFAQSEEIKERFKNEAKILSHLEHENIVMVEDFIEDAAGLHIIMEYVEGRTLDKMIGQEVGPIPYKRALPMFMQILKGIGFAHQKGIIHRDIKPSNIIITPNNKIKIADFGIAKLGGEGIHTKTGTKMGTLLYMSPEQVKGKHMDERSDIYSLGVTLYEMLAGRHPLRTNQAMSEYNLMTKIISEEFPNPKDYYPNIPHWLVNIVFKAIAKDKSDRINNVKEFEELLAEGEKSGGSISGIRLSNEELTVVVKNQANKKQFVNFKPQSPTITLQGISKESYTKEKKYLFLILAIAALLLAFFIIDNISGKEGRLEIIVEPLQAECRLTQNETEISDWTGLKTIDTMSAGNYELTVKLSGYKPEKRAIVIAKGKTYSANIKLEKIMAGGAWAFVEGGTFEMGGNVSPEEKPIHSVTVSSFYMSIYEVTVKEYRAYCNAKGENMPKMPDWGWSENEPIVCVSWNDAQAYCRWAGVRLPTEAEWEFAARGGIKSKSYEFSGSNNISEVGWYIGNSNKKVHPVGSKNANELGIYDMTGNVWEWCSDKYDEYYYSRSESKDPRGPDTGSNRSLRGGSYFIYDNLCRVAYRFSLSPEKWYFNGGFRVVKDL